MSAELFKAVLSQDIRQLRPYINNRGESVITTDTLPINGGGLTTKPYPGGLIFKQQWIALDVAVAKKLAEYMTLTRAITAKSTVDIRNKPMTSTTLEYEEMCDPEDLVAPETERPKFRLGSIPLPAIHSEACSNIYHIRGATTSEVKGCYTENAADAGEEVAKAIEGLTLGTRELEGSYGLFNHPDRIVTSTPLNMLQQLWERQFYGPYMCVYNTEEDQPYIDPEAVIAEQVNGNKITLNSGMGLEYVKSQSVPLGRYCFFQITPDVIQIIVGLDPTLVQFDNKLYVVACVVPRLRVNYRGHVGVATN